MESNRPIPVSPDNGKTAAIVSYMTIIGWLVAYFALYKDNKTKLGAYHLRQTLLLHIISIGLWIVRSIMVAMMLGMGMWAMIGVVGILFGLVFLGLLVLWILGLIGAANEKETPIPVIGPMGQKMFSGI